MTGTEKLFALDGQHRLAGIRNALSTEPDLANDQVSVIVVAHHTDPTGLKRTRKLFTTLNKTAKPVSKSGIIALDEADAMAITARRLVEDDARFSDQRVRVSSQAGLPQKDRSHVMSLINLYDILEIIFTKARADVKTVDLKRLRPSDADLDWYLRLAKSFFGGLEKISPELKAALRAAEPETEIRKHRRTNGGHILFRPVGLLLYADVVASLMINQGLTLEASIGRLVKLPTELSEPPYVSILWNPGTKTMVVRHRKVARDLLLHMIGALPGSTSVAKLKARYIEVLGRPANLPRQI